jgi:hypothetical protein
MLASEGLLPVKSNLVGLRGSRHHYVTVLSALFDFQEVNQLSGDGTRRFDNTNTAGRLSDSNFMVHFLQFGFVRLVLKMAGVVPSVFISCFPYPRHLTLPS